MEMGSTSRNHMKDREPSQFGRRIQGNFAEDPGGRRAKAFAGANAPLAWEQ